MRSRPSCPALAPSPTHSLIAPASDRAEGIASAAAGDLATATQYLSGAVQSFERLEVVFEAALTKEQLAAVASNGRARRLREEASATYEQLGAVPHLERLQAAGRAR